MPARKKSTATKKAPARRRREKLKKQPEEFRRWPENTIEYGEWIRLPRVAVVKLAKMKLGPRHLWLLLMLQTRRYQNKPIRMYWAEIADACGRKKDTVRKWGRQLKKMGLLDVTEVRSRDPEDQRSFGPINQSNIFDISGFLSLVGEEQKKWKEEREKAKAKRLRKKPPEKK